MISPILFSSAVVAFAFAVAGAFLGVVSDAQIAAAQFVFSILVLGGFIARALGK